MRILINAASAHMGGSVTHLQNILKRLPEQIPASKVLVYVPGATTEVLPARPDLDVRAYPYASTQGLQRLYFDQVEIPRLARREEIDVLFSTTGFGTLWSPVPQVLLVRNMKYFDPQFQAKYRELGRSFVRIRLRRWHSLLSIRAAEVVLFPTRAMEDTVGTHVSLTGTSTHALHYGYDRSHFAAGGRGEEEGPEGLRQHVGKEGPLILNVSTYAIHKNLEALIEALPRLLDRFPNLTLLTTTSREQTSDKEEYDALMEQAEKLGVTEAWTELGYVPHEELPAVYRIADAYVFPSITESFGHSMVEAMASGLPIVAADTDVNREVCAGAGSYFVPSDPTDCARTLLGVLENERRRTEMKQASIRRAADFSWEQYTKRLAEIFTETIEEE